MKNNNRYNISTDKIFFLIKKYQKNYFNYEISKIMFFLIFNWKLKIKKLKIKN